jgi:hypothetical protein
MRKDAGDRMPVSGHRQPETGNLHPATLNQMDSKFFRIYFETFTYLSE